MVTHKELWKSWSIVGHEASAALISMFAFIFLDLNSQTPDLYSDISLVLSRNMVTHKELWEILGQL
jgi:hypothetical protein